MGFCDVEVCNLCLITDCELVSLAGSCDGEVCNLRLITEASKKIVGHAESLALCFVLFCCV